MPILRSAAAVACGAIALLTLSCGRATPAEWTMTVARVAPPSAANSSEPQFTASSRGPILSWIERTATTTVLKFAERTGSGWSAPIAAASGDDWFLSYADVPSVTRLGDGTFVAQWLQVIDPVTEAYNLRLSYSKDNGKTWAPSFMPHNDGTRSQHGFASIVEMPGGSVGVVWLDGRNSEFLENDPTSGTMTLRYAAYDSNWKQTADVEIDHNVCECCPTSVAVTADGLLTAYRDRSPDEIRDIVVSRLEGSTWAPAAVVGKDDWKIEFCPVNGPSIAANRRNAVAAWFTVKSDQGQAYAAFSSDAGRTWGMPIRLDDGGSLGRVDVELLDDGSAVVSWVEYAEGRTELRFRRIDSAGQRSAPIAVAPVSGGRASGYPRMARRDNELIFAWTDTGTEEGGQLKLQTAVGEIP